MSGTGRCRAAKAGAFALRAGAPPRASGGFTLIELMVTIAVLVVLVTLAAPAFTSLFLDSRRAATVNDFIAAVNYARATAVTQRVSVTICRSANATQTSASCDTGTSGTGWENGWIIFVDANANGTLDSGENNATSILRRHERLTTGSTLHGNNNIVNRITFNNAGITGNNGTLAYCDRRGFSVNNTRVIVVSVGGRVRSAQPNPSAPSSDPLSISGCL